MSGRNSKTRTRAWGVILPPPANAVFPPGTGAVVETGGAPAVTNGAVGSVLTSNGPAVAPTFQTPIIPQQPLGAIRFVDPSNSTGFASDSNTGATNNNVPPGSGPILTTAHLNDLLFDRKLTADTTITYMSDDASSVGLNYATLDPAGSTLTIQMTPVVTHTGGTINAGTTAINPAAGGGGQRQLVHTSDLATFNPFVFSGNGGASADPQRLVDTTGGNNNTGAWVVSGVATASVSRPVTPIFTAGTFTNGDSYKIQRGGHITLAAMAQVVNSSGSVGGVVINDAAFLDNTVGGNGATYNRCSWRAQLGVGIIGGNDCYVPGVFTASTSFEAEFDITLNSGVLLATLFDSFGGLLSLSGDTYITGNGLWLMEAAYANIFVFAGIGSGIQINDTVGASGGLVVAGSHHIGDVVGSEGGFGALIWGNGNAGPGISIASGGTAGVSSSSPPTVTGAAGDFRFMAENGAALVSVARAFDNTTGEYTEAGGVATRTTTWAHFVAAIGAGGFGFQAHYPAANAHIVGT